MGKFTRDIILLVKDDRILEEEIETKVNHLHNLIASVETMEVFAQVHELVARNKITRKKFRILDAIKSNPLKPFYFLINKN